jgi:predicted esterase
MVLALALSALTGCASQQEELVQWTSSHGASASTIQTSSFTLQTVTPLNLQVNKTLTIFIEGDGKAWATSSQPSLDPTPRALSTLALAMNTPHPGVYLARPCQFVMSAGCEKTVWTDARFSRAVINATQEAVEALKKRYGAEHIELIGYSGGAAVALLVAGERDDVVQIQTISGNTNPKAWVAFNELSSLNGSLDPLTNRHKLSTIPQRHFVGTEDTIIPLALTEDFVRKISAQCAEIVKLPGDHASVIANLTGESLSRPIHCESR